MPWPHTGATQHQAQLGLPDKGRAIKGWGFCNNWDLEPLYLLNGLALASLLSTGLNLVVLVQDGSEYGSVSDGFTASSGNELLFSQPPYPPPSYCTTSNITSGYALRGHWGG